MPPSKETIRILIVDDMVDMRDNLRKLLSFEPDFEVVGAAQNGMEGVKLAKQFQPNIILMDINMPGGMDGIGASEAISKEVPSAAIIMMSVQSESDYLRRSMLAGARDFLTKPFTSDELVSTIRRVYDMNRTRAVAVAPQPQQQQQQQQGGGDTGGGGGGGGRRGGKVIAVWGTKGGVGSSMLAINLAVALAEDSSLRVALVDVSLQFGDVGILLNLQPAHSIADAVPNIDDLEEDFLKNLMASHASGVRVLLAPPRPEMADLVTGEHVKNVLEEMRRYFDVIVVDMPKSLTDHVLGAIDVCDRIMVVTTAEIPALAHTRAFLEVMDTLKYDKAKLMLVVNKYDKRAGGISVQDIEDAIKAKVVADIVLDPATAIRSVNQGAPVVSGDRSKPLAQSYMQLAARVRKELLPQPEAVPAGGKQPDDKGRARLGRLFGSG